MTQRFAAARADAELLDRARAQYSHCLLCEHRCGVDRYGGERGKCKAGSELRLFRHRIEYGEEPELVPSHLFYLSGCDLRCVFCIAGINAFDPGRGQILTQELFDTAVAWGQQRGAKNIQWVGGEPTIHLPAILELMAASAVLPPVVWKSDFYGTPAAFAMLYDKVDVFVADFKFGDDRCAKRLAGVDNYTAIIERNLCLVADRANLIVRHLLLPGHLECCYRPIVQWMKTHLPGAKFSVRDGFLPQWQAAKYEELSRPLAAGGGSAARGLAIEAGLNLIY
jgi:putative pyruvate formate lyase activating enzyme